MSGSLRRQNLEAMSNRKLKDVYYRARGRIINLKQNKKDFTEVEYKSKKKNIQKQIREIKSVLKNKGIKYGG